MSRGSFPGAPEQLPYGYLKHLPIDYLKIDGSFIKDIVNNPHDQVIVRSFNEIAHFMGKQTVAEFVENAETLSLMRELGIDHVQGYAIARPGFIDEFFTRH
ncbi:EAL domain-containing protein [Thermochromatium tepidum]|uniref:EAL domain-containing protein n=1 Tax=Thermochromatium tepidum ATCC 43061 TaxID=316276 RepID=A0A6I6ELV7_THETI|nr:EAL domain-containing protein [Thermochromatium tepidum]QGU33967.1 EAL domain-containing protein [Thermochromatium tepidum ATCC 43061]